MLELVVLSKLGKFSGGILRPIIRDEGFWDAMASKNAFEVSDNFCRSRPIESSDLYVSRKVIDY